MIGYEIAPEGLQYNGLCNSCTRSQVYTLSDAKIWFDNGWIFVCAGCASDIANQLIRAAEALLSLDSIRNSRAGIPPDMIPALKIPTPVKTKPRRPKPPPRPAPAPDPCTCGAVDIGLLPEPSCPEHG